VCSVPSRLTHRTETTSFGWYLVVMVVSEPGVVIGWPLTAVITSPGTMPATSAAVSHSTPTMSAPAAIGATFCGTTGWALPVWQAELPLRVPPALISSEACCVGLWLSLVATSTPRKPGTPM
jgi:hypothetical protein